MWGLWQSTLTEDRVGHDLNHKQPGASKPAVASADMPEAPAEGQCTEEEP